MSVTGFTHVTLKITVEVPVAIGEDKSETVTKYTQLRKRFAKKTNWNPIRDIKEKKGENISANYTKSERGESFQKFIQSKSSEFKL